MVTRYRAAIAAGACVLLVITALVMLVDDPEPNPTRLRERVILSDEVSSVLTGATVSLVGADPLRIEVMVGSEVICTFESRRPRAHFATIGSDTWVVIVRRVSADSRTADVRVDRIPDSDEPSGCRSEARSDGD